MKTNMKNEFVIYEQALALKELGFDEPCLAFYSPKYRLYPIIDSFVGVKGVVKFFYKLPMYDETFNTYEEAESACLNKLIEICKNK